ncbi:alpha/beta fold hydrolase, partial [candidate division KSB3 bacterium]|nr:alpha/beta fold hydrolase [candidate division KSB3 bacterium]MBD3325459.1 alpha/beta fold hydrolase [candidate division KSB3 bacterium]
EYPVYGLQPPGLEGDDLPVLTTIEAMAAFYLAEMRQIQPVGPYYLLGRCFGGVIAFEMAQQLVAQGQEVALLALLDTMTPPGQPRPNRSQHPFRKRLKRLIKLWKRLRSQADVFTGLRGLSYRHYHRLERVWRAQQQARQTYVPRVYSGKITFFWPAAKRWKRREGWRALTTQPLVVHRAPGTHKTMTQEPHVRVLAETLRTCLAQAHALSEEERLPGGGDDITIPRKCIRGL